MNPNPILEGIVGSTAYGMAHADSDIDYLGVWRASIEEMLGLDPPVGKSATVVQHDPNDRQLHEVGKFVRLAMAANPTILELLWLPEDCYTVRTDPGDLLVRDRGLFLSNRVRSTYIGYARQQIARAKSREDGSFAADLRKRTEKHGRHVARLLLSGRSAVTTGEVLVRLDEDQVAWCREMGEHAAADIAEFEWSLNPLLEEIDESESVLPDEVDRDAIEALLLAVRGV